MRRYYFYRWYPAHYVITIDIGVILETNGGDANVVKDIDIIGNTVMYEYTKFGITGETNKLLIIKNKDNNIVLDCTRIKRTNDAIVY